MAKSNKEVTITHILGLWISENEGAKFWLNNFTEMKNRGLKDILIACSDNLTGMSEAIAAVYPVKLNISCVSSIKLGTA